MKRKKTHFLLPTFDHVAIHTPHISQSHPCHISQEGQSPAMITSRTPLEMDSSTL